MPVRTTKDLVSAVAEKPVFGAEAKHIPDLVPSLVWEVVLKYFTYRVITLTLVGIENPKKG